MPSYPSQADRPLLQASGEPFLIPDSVLCTVDGCGHSPAAHSSDRVAGSCRAGKCTCSSYLAPEPEARPLHVWVRVALENLPRETISGRGAASAWSILQACGQAEKSGVLDLNSEQAVWLRKLLEEPQAFETLGYPAEAIREIIQN